ncbi:trypsin-like peptidase domain-containing protein [Candidatus Berkelbacteria bacterium]|nr:trypsin-like peptidase domain-containing protein [Candidatus Berkelbacteria bacterium]
MDKRVISWIVIFSLMMGLTGGVGGAALLAGSPFLKKLIGVEEVPTGSDDTKSVRTERLVLQESSAVIDTVKQVSPAVVSISTSRNVRDFFGDLITRQGGGTGFIITSDGLIVTNKHVVDDPAAQYTVFLADGRNFTPEIVAKDPFADLAILRIQASGLLVVELGDSDRLQVGEWAVAIGNALAQFENTVTVGVISAKDRHLEASGGAAPERLEGLLQTDAAINAGNSGGPLLNLKGQVVGVNTAVAAKGVAEGIGFAIPINAVKNSINQVKKTGKISQPYLGVRYIPITKEIAKLNNLPVDFGALIASGQGRGEVGVLPNSPAAKAGLRENDIITQISGDRIDENHSLTRLLTNHSVGDEIELTVMREGKELKLKARLEELKQ